MKDISRITVIGAGTMGHGIAQVAALSGYEVVLHDADPPAINNALTQIRKNLEKGVKRGKVTDEQRETALNNIVVTAELQRSVREADLVIEAIVENLEIKQKLFDDVNQAAPSHAILATNTSSLPVTRICSALSNRGRVVGMHFFNPVHIMKLVEIVVHPGTDEVTRDTAVEVTRRMGKEPIVVKDSPGFASSRLGIVLGLEAMRMLEQGVASAEDIDKAMELGYNHPMGPLKLTDLVGLDVRLAISEFLHRELQSEAFRPPDILRRNVEEGRLGKKSGRGFYDWSDS